MRWLLRIVVGGFDPMSRWFALIMDRVVGADFEAGLDNLKRPAEAG